MVAGGIVSPNRCALLAFALLLPGALSACRGTPEAVTPPPEPSAQAEQQPATREEGEVRLLSLDIAPVSPAVGDELTITAVVENSSDKDESYSAVAIVNGIEAPVLSVAVPALDRGTLQFTVHCERMGPLEIRVGELSRTVFVRERITVIGDPAGDWVGPSGKLAAGDACLDLASFEVSCLGNEVVFSLTVHGAIPPESPTPDASMRWDAAIDTDPGVNNGLKSAVLYNDTRPDCVARVELTGGAMSGRLLTVRNNSWQDIDCTLEDGAVEMRVPLSALGDRLNFDCVGVASAYRREGSSTNLVVADRAPETGHVAVAIRDADGDGLSDAGEATYGTDPTVADTDGDSATDGDEVLTYGSDPLAPEDWRTLDGLAAVLNTPAKVSVYLEQHFTPAAAPGHTPLATVFETMAGDCDEYAGLASYWLAANGYEVYRLMVVFDGWWPEFNTWRKHEICVYREPDGLWYAIDIFFHSNPGTQNPVGPFESLAELCDTMPARNESTTWTSYELRTHDLTLVETVEQ